MLQARGAAWDRRRGQVSILVAVCLTGMVGVAAIALDGGVLLDDYRQAQAAADAAALAAAIDLAQNFPTNQGADPSGTAAKSAQTTASANGFTNGSNGATVTVNIPPKSGTFSGQAGYAEVIVQYSQARYFSGIFGSAPITVQARAVARGLQTAFSKAAILLLDPNGAQALNDQGGGLTVTGAPVLINSSNSMAAYLTGNAILTAPQVEITGGSSMSGNAYIQGSVSYGAKPTPDPLAKLAVPDSSTMTVQASSVSSYSGGVVSLKPGVYKGGIINTGATITMAPGVYYLNGGGLNLSGGTLTGSGVMIYNNPVLSTDSISISGTANVTLSPPTSGTYEGLTIFQNRTSSVQLTLAGGGTTNLTGTFYAAGARFNISGNGTSTLGSQYISGDLTVTGTGTFNIPWSLANVARQRDIRLVE